MVVVTGFFCAAHGFLCFIVSPEAGLSLTVAQPALNLLIDQLLGCLLLLEALSPSGPISLCSCHSAPWRG